METKRQGEIALKLVKFYIHKKGISFSQNDIREFRNVAKAIGISVEEFKQFVMPLVEQLVNQWFAKEYSENQGGAASSLKG